jgi:Protein of unknown function (DUF3455)
VNQILLHPLCAFYRHFLLFCYTRSMRILAACLIAGAVSIAALHAQQTEGSVDPPPGAQAVLEAKGVGFQVYTCTQSQAGPKWVLTAPDAKLLDASGKTIGSHFAGPTWKLEDGSQVQGERIASRPATEADSVAWLLLRAKAGTGTGRFANIAFIRRTETHGGAAAESACTTGDTSRVAYTATYTFYTAK